MFLLVVVSEREEGVVAFKNMLWIGAITEIQMHYLPAP